ncbi:hypothetical protein KIPB_009944 [Kipferlia bialata]|uniref:TNFR-Cys domain-containing protein n=1 Tax=Kipferlia bialata TaxID=797122 RepID=A0A9K3D2E7_9EUKA|nr:hypothetical protein KIPB_009944 [Kipferlia bialata]|eukprot:g9944.t1
MHSTIVLCLLLLTTLVSAETFDSYLRSTDADADSCGGVETVYEPELQLQSCMWDKTYNKCLGSCSTGTGYCIEYAHQQCGCSKCGFDLGTQRCQGACSYPTGCVLTSNSTCACTACGWSSPKMDFCEGFCSSGSTCMQTSEHSKCTCTNYSNQCVYDYASDKCYGNCSSGKNCIQTKPGKCTCADCAYDYGMDTCRGSCFGGEKCEFYHGHECLCGI